SDYPAVFLAEPVRQVRAVFVEVFPDGRELLPPALRFHGEQGFHGRGRHVRTLDVDVAGLWQEADRRFARTHASLAAIDDPLQNTQVVAESRPEELAVRILPEPVDVKDRRQLVGA